MRIFKYTYDVYDVCLCVSVISVCLSLCICVYCKLIYCIYFGLCALWVQYSTHIITIQTRYYTGFRLVYMPVRADNFFFLNTKESPY